MDELLRFIDDENFVATCVVIFILYCVGKSMVRSRPYVRDWGFRIAVACCVAFVGWRGVTTKASNASAWIPIAFRGLLVAGLVLAVTWIVLTVVVFVFDLFLGWPVRTVAGWMQASSRRRGERALRRREDIDRARAAATAVVQETPESRQAREKEQRQAQAERAERARAGAQCENLRAECELFYSSHAPEIRARFPKKELAAFMQKYMGDDRTTEQLTHRAQQLKAIITYHLECVRPSPKFASVDQVARWFREQKQAIEALDIEERMKKTHLAELSERYAELTSQLLENAKS